jgi:hypothetical protein
MRKQWSIDDDAYLICYDGFEASLMAYDLDRTPAAIYQRRHFLKSEKGNERLAQALLRLHEFPPEEKAA